MSTAQSVLVFGGIVLALQIAVMLVRKRGWGVQSVRLVGITFIVVIAAFLTAADIPQDRFSAAIGLFGTVAGYLLGKTDAKAESKNED